MAAPTSKPAPWPRPARVAIVVDSPGWYDEFAERLAVRLSEANHLAKTFRSYADVPVGDIAFYLSCMRITPPEVLAKNSWNFVVHASDLPKGRGFSPLVWQVLEGADEIPVTMILMAKEVDAGDIVAQTCLQLSGHELNTEMRAMLGQAIEDLCVSVVLSPTPPTTRKQQGTPSWYNRRRPTDSALDPAQSLASQFDLLRVVDNERYPAYFDYRGHRYILKIEDTGPTPTAQNGKDNA